MEKNILTCPLCGRRLADLLGEVGQRRRIKPCDGVKVRIEKNALGEDMGWLSCPKCRTDVRFDSAHWLGPS
jgi:hypothetical protein